LSNIALVYRLHKIWNARDIELIDRVYAENFVAHWPASSEVPERRGIDGVRFGVERIRRAVPDWHEKVLDAFRSCDQGSGALFRTLGARLEHAASCGLRREDLLPKCILPLPVQECTIT
jgi:hypothetical protein